MPLLECRILKIDSFPHFSLTRFDILSWNFAYDFVLLYYRSSSSVVNFRLFPSIFVGVMPLLECRILKIHSFPHFSLTHFDLLSWNLHFTLFYCTTDQVRVSSICVNFCGSYAPFKYRILKIHSFPHFSLTRFDLLSWNFAFHFVLLYYRSSSSVVNLRQFLWELCPSGT